MNPYYLIGFLIGLSIGIFLVWEYLPYVNYINKSRKKEKQEEKEKELENKSNSSFDID